MKKIHFLLIILFSISGLITAQEKPFKKTLKINGRIQTDYEFMSTENGGFQLNGFEFRRIHLSASGKISKKIQYKVETDFAHAQIGFRDVYIKFLGDKYGNFIIGSYPEPTSLDIMTSSKYIPFNERAMLTSLQNFRWGAGLHYENFNLLNKKVSLQLAMTHNGKNTSGFLDTELEKGNNWTGRLTAIPLYDKNKKQLIHLGLNYANRPTKDLVFRAENHLGDKYHYVFPNSDKRMETGLEFAGEIQNFSLQAEYKTQNINNSINKKYQTKSYYALVSFFLTGENRPYKKGAFRRVKPKKDIEHGGYGAFEVLTRFSNISVSQDILTANPGLPEKINNISLGINWYLNSHTRFMYNYVITDDENNFLGKIYAHLFRVQIDF